MIKAEQAKRIANQKNHNYLVELTCEKIDQLIRERSAQHIDWADFPVPNEAVQGVKDILEKNGYTVYELNTHYPDGTSEYGGTIQIQWA